MMGSFFHKVLKAPLRSLHPYFMEHYVSIDPRKLQEDIRLANVNGYSHFRVKTKDEHSRLEVDTFIMNGLLKFYYDTQITR